MRFQAVIDLHYIQRKIVLGRWCKGTQRLATFARAEDAGSTPARSTKGLGGRLVCRPTTRWESVSNVLGRPLAGICVYVRSQHGGANSMWRSRRSAALGGDTTLPIMTTPSSDENRNSAGRISPRHVFETRITIRLQRDSQKLTSRVDT